MEQNCSFHRNMPADRQCSNCGRWFCNDCLFTAGGKYYCKTRQCGTVYLSLIKGTAKEKERSTKTKGSFIRKTGVGLLFFSLINLVFSINKPVNDLSMFAQLNSPEMMQYLPEFKKITEGFTAFFSLMNALMDINLYLASAGILLGGIMIGRLKPARMLFIVYLSVNICFTIGSSYALYQQIQILRGGLQASPEIMPAMPFLGPLVAGIGGGLSVVVLTMLWLLIKFLRLEER
ncbi:MAG: hypothetical protein HYV28_01870 [Ignavibacteriales bacterium]|nr:hypothetical protein [Ignavibacteriales bacterium]